MCSPVAGEGHSRREGRISVSDVRCYLSWVLQQVRTSERTALVVVETLHYPLIEHPPVVVRQLWRAGSLSQVEDECVMTELFADRVPPLAFPAFVVGEGPADHADPAPGHPCFYLAPDVLVERLPYFALLEWLTSQIGTQ